MTKNTLAIAAALMLIGGVANAQSNPSAGQGAHHGRMAMEKAPSQGVVTTGTIRRVDTAKRVVNLSHGPIPAIGWPAMTMDFNVAPEVNLSDVQPGQAVRVTLVPAAAGTYSVSAIEPGS